MFSHLGFLSAVVLSGTREAVSRVARPNCRFYSPAPCFLNTCLAATLVDVSKSLSRILMVGLSAPIDCRVEHMSLVRVIQVVTLLTPCDSFADESSTKANSDLFGGLTSIIVKIPAQQTANSRPHN